MLKIEGRPDFQGCAVDDREEKIETLLRHCSGELVSRFFSRFSVAVQRVIRIEQRILRGRRTMGNAKVVWQLDAGNAR